MERFFAKLCLIRTVEERLLSLFSDGVLQGTTHTCIGQEADAVGLIEHLRPDDLIFSNHRCHGHFLAKTDNPEGLLAEAMGRQTGVCGGLGGSQHLHCEGFYSNGILGGTVANAVGAALAEKYAGSKRLTLAFLGDGTLGEGIVYESFNMAALWSVPVVFVIEHNRYAQSTPSQLQIAGEVAARPQAFGIETHEITSTDVAAIHAWSGPLLAKARTQSKPVCLLIHTYRLAPHSKGDDFRDPAEIEAYRRQDPLAICGQQLSQDVRDRIQAEVTKRVDAAVAAALAAPPATLGAHA